MPRKPNYRFERMQRDRDKAAKKAAKREAKAARRAAARTGGDPDLEGIVAGEQPVVDTEEEDAPSE